MFATTRPYSSLGFRKWIELETSKNSIAKATEGVEFPQKILDYLSVVYGKTKEGYWKDTVFSFTKALQDFSVEISVPIIKNAPKDGKDADWDYEGRMWNHFSHILARAYGWTLEYISDLEVNEAFGHIQEILTNDHLEHEFLYSLSELAYPYNKSTKKGEFKPMTRPYWMRPVHKPIKKMKIKRSLLPVGYIVDASGMAEELGWSSIVTKENIETKETDASRNSQPVPPAS